MPVSNKGPDFLLIEIEGFNVMINVKRIRKDLIIMRDVRIIDRCLIGIEVYFGFVNRKERVVVIVC